MISHVLISAFLLKFSIGICAECFVRGVSLLRVERLVSTAVFGLWSRSIFIMLINHSALTLLEFSLIFSAYVTREGENEPVTLELSDNGRGADLIAEDGIYSAYFTDYEDVTGRYKLECTVGTENIQI